MTDHEAELEKLCERLEATRWSAGVSVPVNPDGPEAARLLREMAAENERLRGTLDAIASFSDTPGKVFAERFPDLAAKVREHLAPFSSKTLCQFARQALTKGKPHD